MSMAMKKTMPHPFAFDAAKAIEAVVHLAGEMENPTLHKVFKILYFADRLHLGRYGRFICGDRYAAMKHGPVPSEIYDITKAVRGESLARNDEIAARARKGFGVRGKYIICPKRKPDCGEFSDSDLECLNKAAKKYGRLSFQKLTELSHDSAWEAADDNDWISVESIVHSLSPHEMKLDKDALLLHLKDPHP